MHIQGNYDLFAMIPIYFLKTRRRPGGDDGEKRKDFENRCHVFVICKHIEHENKLESKDGLMPMKLIL